MTCMNDGLCQQLYFGEQNFRLITALCDCVCVCVGLCDYAYVCVYVGSLYVEALCVYVGGLCDYVCRRSM